MAFVETPRTNYGDESQLGIENVSPEKSWHAPPKQGNDLVSRLRGQRGLDLRTPNARNPLALRPNQQKAPASDEISLLLKSTARPAAVRNRENFGAPKTPAVLRNGYRDADTPALDAGAESFLASSEAGSFADGRTPLPAMPSSSAQSTPLADIGGKNFNSLVSDTRNQRTLRDQENTIDKLEKDNFGLKLKIHYLEEALRKQDPNYNQTAVKENADLKVEKQLLQRDAGRLRKQVKTAEQEAERLRDELLKQEKEGQRTGQEGSNAKDEALRLRQELDEAQQELEELKDQLRHSDQQDSRVEKLEADVDDLEAELRQKDVEINERDEKLEKMDEKIEELQTEAERQEEKIEQLQTEASKVEDNEERAEEIQELKDQIGDLEADKRALQNDLDLAAEAREDLEQQKNEALVDLKELQEEMADRSMHPKGFAEEIEQRARKLERELREALGKYETAEQELDQQKKQTRDVQNRLDLSREEATSREESLKSRVALFEKQVKTLTQEHDSSDSHVQHIQHELQSTMDARDTLKSKYDAAIEDSRQLQEGLEDCKREIKELQEELEFERRQATENEAALREETNADREDLQADLYDLRRRLENAQDELEVEQEKWESEKRQLSSQKDQASARADGLEEKLQELQTARDDGFGKESQLKDVLAGEEQRHRREQNLLKGQIEQMEAEIKQKQLSLDQHRAELTRIKDEAWASSQEAADSVRKIQGLEDEIQVLSSMVEDEQKRTKERVDVARQEADLLRQELFDVKQTKQQLESSLRDMQDYTQRIPQTPAATRDARQRLEQRVSEQDGQLERLKHQKESLESKLKRAEDDFNVSRRRNTELEADLRQALAVKSAKSPARVSVVDSSSHKEVEDLRKQLRQVREEADGAREKRRQAERELRNKLSEAEAASRQRLYSQDQLRDDFEARVSELESQLRESEALRQSAEKTAGRLRTRIDSLEKDVKSFNTRRAKDSTLAAEHDELQTTLKEARLEAENLSSELAAANAKLDGLKGREGEQKSLIKRLRSERSAATARNATLDEDLQDLQARYNRKVDDLRNQKNEVQRQKDTLDALARQMDKQSAKEQQQQQRRSSEAERRLLKHDERHQQELAGLVKQIQWLRAKGRREEAFRAGLAFEKRFLLMNVEMYQSFNQVDLRLLEKMGIKPGTTTTGEQKRRPSIRAAAHVVIAIARMRQGMQKWRESRKLKETLVNKVEQMQAKIGASGKRKAVV